MKKLKKCFDDQMINKNTNKQHNKAQLARAGILREKCR
jgi:hypothetical protein